FRHRRPFPVQQEPVFVFQALESGGRDVVLLRRARGLAHRCSQRSLRSHFHRVYRAFAPLSVVTTHHRNSWPSKNSFTPIRSSRPCERTSSMAPNRTETP